MSSESEPDSPAVWHENEKIAIMMISESATLKVNRMYRTCSPPDIFEIKANALKILVLHHDKVVYSVLHRMDMEDS